MAPRSALLILGLQNEFLDPEAGRCVMAAPDPGNPTFVENIKAFVPYFRANGGDVIWVRSEYKKARDFIDPRNDETLLILNEDSDSESEVEDSKNNREDAGRQRASSSPGKPRVAKGGRPPLRTDAFLAVESDHPPCAPSTNASEFHPSVLPVVNSPPDRISVKTWFSAFKETGLLETLRGRFVSDLYICGVLTNACVLATAADAAKHGLNVYVLQDCLGYRSKLAHQQSLKVMADDYGVEEVRSGLLVKNWERQRLKRGGNGTNGGGSAGIQLGATNLSKEQLVKMVAGLKVGSNEGTEKQSGEVVGSSTISSPPPVASDPLPTITEDDANSLKELQEEMKSKQGKVAEEQAVVGVVKDTEIDKEKKVEEAGEVKKDEGEKKDGKEKVYKEHRKKKSQTGKDSKRSGVKPASKNDAPSSTKFDSKSPVVGEGDVLGEGDTMLVKNILSDFLAKRAFDKLKKEVSWRTMYHRGGEVPRMVAVEGEIDEDGSFPIYRHPADESPPLLPFSHTVQLIRQRVQEVLNHPVNHVLIQHYRDGNDYISEHSDKTLDIVRGSKIVNVSLGAQRTMILRTKKDAAREKSADAAQKGTEGPGPERTAQRIPLPHNSMFVLGLESNKKWLHGIRQDRRLQTLKSPEELSYNGERISLTFRHIGTFLSADEKEIYGQGAVSKSKDEPRPVINGDHPETERLIQAFGSENHQSDFDWDASYGAGFDVLHLVPQLPKLFFAKGDVNSDRVRMCLVEKGIEFSPHELQPDEVNTPSFRSLSPRGITPVLVDVDREKSTICEPLAILQYLEMFYPSKDSNRFLLPSLIDERAAFAMVLQRMQESERVWITLSNGTKEQIEDELDTLNGYLVKTGKYFGGEELTLADIAMWPVLDQFIKRTGWALQDRWDVLWSWKCAVSQRNSAKKLYGAAEEVEDKLEAVMAGLNLQEKEVEKTEAVKET